MRNNEAAADSGVGVCLPDRVTLDMGERNRSKIGPLHPLAVCGSEMGERQGKVVIVDRFVPVEHRFQG